MIDVFDIRSIENNMVSNKNIDMRNTDMNKTVFYIINIDYVF